MKIQNTLWIIVLMLATSQAWAYGSGSSSKKACSKPKFTQLTPVNNAQVSPGSAFSFDASAVPNPETIKVTVKDQPVDVAVAAKNQGFHVSGKLPDSLKDTFARISITAEGPDQCKGNDGWLVKITE